VQALEQAEDVVLVFLFKADAVIANGDDPFLTIPLSFDLKYRSDVRL
jgi:hypothetical protein